MSSDGHKAPYVPNHVKRPAEMAGFTVRSHNTSTALPAINLETPCRPDEHRRLETNNGSVAGTTI